MNGIIIKENVYYFVWSDKCIFEGFDKFVYDCHNYLDKSSNIRLLLKSFDYIHLSELHLEIPINHFENHVPKYLWKDLRIK